MSTRSERGPLGQELRDCWTLAWPVVLAELGGSAMGIVDTLMVGRLGPTELGAVGIGHALASAVFVVGMGMIMGLDTLVSQAYGAGRAAETRQHLLHGLGIVAVLMLPSVLLVQGLLPTVQTFALAFGLNGIDSSVLTATAAYLSSASWSLAPMLIFMALRRYLQAVDRTRPIAFGLILANVINVGANQILIFGVGSWEGLGVYGAGVATLFARITMLIVVYVAVFGEHWTDPWRFFQQSGSAKWNWSGVVRLLKLGLPISGHFLVEVGVFATATVLIGMLGEISAAAHNVVLNMATVSFMIPMAISSAAAVRVGHAVGRGDPAGASRAGWTCLGLGVTSGTIAALTFLLVPRTLMWGFTDDPEVIALGVSLLVLAAIFQLFDAVQVIATGALRGLGETRWPVICNFIAHWIVGLPFGAYLAWSLDFGVRGFWAGLSLGLILVGISLTGFWIHEIRRLRSGEIFEPDRFAPAEAMA